MRTTSFPNYLICVLLLILLCACGKTTVKADISEYGNTPILIIGLMDEPFEVTPNELKELECETKSASGKTEKAGTVSAIGPTLNIFVKEYGFDLTDFKKVRFTASDGYAKSFQGATLEKCVIILAVANGDNPLTTTEAPLRILPSGLDSEYWVRMVTKIEFEKE